MHRSMRVAFCGVLTALCVLLMFMTGLIPVGTYALPAFSGILLIAAVIELGASWAWPVYIASSALSLLIAADKEAVMLYILFFGYYPILKALIEKKDFPKFLSYLIKFTVFNVAMVLGYFISIWVLGVPQDSFVIFGVNLPMVFLILGNITFAVYDYAISTLVISYMKKIHKPISRWLHLK